MTPADLARSAPLLVAASTALEVGGDRAPEALLLARHRSTAGEPLAVAVLRGQRSEDPVAVLLVDHPADPAVRAIGDFPELDDEPFVLSEVWLPYLPTAELGVLVAWTRNLESVTAIRHGETVDDFAVTPELLLSVLWNTKCPDSHAWLRSRRLELTSGAVESWTPAAELPRSLVRRDRFVDACRRHASAWASRASDAGRDAWAWSALTSVWNAVDKLPLVRHILEAASLDEEDLLGALGAGPLEDMESDWLLDQLASDLHEDRRWLYALSMVHGFRVPGPLGDRFAAMLTADEQDWLRAKELDR